jgi:hypothetical protein
VRRSWARQSRWSVSPLSIGCGRPAYLPDVPKVVQNSGSLRGQLSPDGNSIVNGTIEWTYHPCCGVGTGTYQAAWRAAINTVPGSDPERASLGSLAPSPQSGIDSNRIVNDVITHTIEWGIEEYVKSLISRKQ